MRTRNLVGASCGPWTALPLVGLLAACGGGAFGSRDDAPDASNQSEPDSGAAEAGDAAADGGGEGGDQSGGAAGQGGATTGGSAGTAGASAGGGSAGIEHDAGGSAGTGGLGGAAGSSGEGGAGGAVETCGNGLVDPLETCDIAIPPGDPGACEASCDDHVACTQDALSEGGTCKAACSHVVVDSCVPGDGCCPSACNATTDSDCSPTCGNGVVEANELCDTAIAPGQPGSCPTSCGDGIPCTADTLINAGTCTAQCTSSKITSCTNQDGCCALGCEADEDCAEAARFKQTVVTESGALSWSHNGYWNGSGYANWTPWSGTDLSQLVAGYGNAQRYRCIDESKLSSGLLKQTALSWDGTVLFSRYGTWNGSGYEAWTAWSSQYGNLSSVVTGQGSSQAYRSFDHVLLPDNRVVQTLLTIDGRKLWQRTATWDGNVYTWSGWTSTELTSLLPGKGDNQSFRSFDQAAMGDTRLKQSVLTDDGKTVWSRYGTWDGSSYASFTEWSDIWGNLRQLLPGQGADQSFLCFQQATLGGAGYVSGCQNGCDDADPCTDDTCVANMCQHVPKSCDDGNGCTQDACVGGACQHAAMNCDDGNPCTDDYCSNGCQHINNAASCYGGQCQYGTCQASCQCNGGCTDTCGNACNSGAACALNAVCTNGGCACAHAYCAGVCCAAGETCSSGVCCGSQADRCANRCGVITDKCGTITCPSSCEAGLKCCPGGYCDETCS